MNPRNAQHRQARRLFVILGLLASGPVQAGMMADWDVLPLMRLVRFEPDRVLLGTAEGKCLALLRASRRLVPVRCNTGILFQNTKWHKPPRGLVPEFRDAVAYFDSNGERWTSSPGNCGEGTHHTPLLWHERKAFRARIEPCHGVSAVEVRDRKVFLGTLHDGTYGPGEGEGLLVQDLETEALLGRLRKKDGLSGDLVRWIRFDPFSDSIWVFSHRGYNRIDEDLHILETGYFQLDYPARTGETRVVIRDTFQPLNLLAAVAERVDIRDRPAFARAARKIPRSALHELTAGDMECIIGGDCAPGGSQLKFLPDDFLPVLPFFLEAAERELNTGTRVAMASLCAFRDQRVLDFMNAVYDKPHNDRDMHVVTECLVKHYRVGEQERCDEDAGYSGAWERCSPRRRHRKPPPR
jgi:hypothetical protein